MYILISVLMLAFRDGAVGEEGGEEGGGVMCYFSEALKPHCSNGRAWGVSDSGVPSRQEMDSIRREKARLATCSQGCFQVVPAGA